ncbi:hypothetical protein L7F22_042402 [Adiantum nelumboides]|nr:hypothetical protein [Adiantum nelumboides]
MELQGYGYTFKVEDSVRAQLANTLSYCMHEKIIKVPNEKSLPPPPTKAGGGLVLVSLKGEVAAREQMILKESTSNNEAEYDVLINGLKMCLAQGIQRLVVKDDALLIVKQILGIWACKNERLRSKVTIIRKLCGQFQEMQLYHIPRKENEDAKLACSTDYHRSR